MKINNDQIFTYSFVNILTIFIIMTKSFSTDTLILGKKERSDVISTNNKKKTIFIWFQPQLKSCVKYYYQK